MKLWLLLLPSKRRLTKVWTSLLIAIYQAYMITFSYVTILSISYAQGVKKFMPKTAQPISKVQKFLLFYFFAFKFLHFTFCSCTQAQPHHLINLFIILISLLNKNTFLCIHHRRHSFFVLMQTLNGNFASFKYEKRSLWDEKNESERKSERAKRLWMIIQFFYEYNAHCIKWQLRTFL